MAEKKYKVADLAKDIGKTNKDVIEFFAEGSDEPKKKSTTALEPKDLDLFFNKMTIKTQVESFDKYFAMADEAPKKAPKKAKAEEVDENTTETEQTEGDAEAAPTLSENVVEDTNNAVTEAEDTATPVVENTKEVE